MQLQQTEQGSGADAPGLLLVDDEPDLMALLASRFRTIKGIRVETAASGEEALSKLGSFRPRLVVADLAMPRMSGWDLIRRMQEHPDGRDVRVLLMTAMPTTEVERRASSIGIAGVVAKPFDMEYLVRTVQTELARPVGSGPLQPDG